MKHTSILKKTFLLFTFVSVFATQWVMANADFYETYLSISLNGGAESYYGTGAGNPTFNGANLGSISAGNTLVIKNRGVNTWNDGGSDVTSARLFYRIYRQGTGAPGFTQVTLPQNGGAGNNKYWNVNTPEIDLLSGVSGPLGAVFVVELYWEASTNGVNVASTIYNSNGGANYIATFTLATALDVELMSFTAASKVQNVELAWATSSERNNSHFEIERSADGRNWSNIGEVKGNDTQERVNNYTFRDERPLSGMNYYRLKQVDFNGNYEYSRAVSVRFSNRTLTLSVSPNPVTDRLTIQGINTENGILEVVDPSGVVLMTVRNATAINVGTLAAGTYVLRYQSEDGETSQCRFVKK